MDNIDKFHKTALNFTHKSFGNTQHLNLGLQKSLKLK